MSEEEEEEEGKTFGEARSAYDRAVSASVAAIGPPLIMLTIDS